jgi:hypothetical protein
MAEPPQPGSPAFAARLLERMRSDAAIGGDVSLGGMRGSSRNTLIYRARAPRGDLVCKVATGEREVEPALEHRALLELRNCLAGSDFRCLEPVAVYPELGVLVTREEPGATVRHYLDAALASPRQAEARRFTEALMERCAAALFRFHAGFGLTRDERGFEQARCYVDFHPGNLLVPAGGHTGLVLMDPPQEPQVNLVHADLATFCFSLARAGFAPFALARGSQGWLDELKATFLAAYFRRLGRAPGERDFARLEALEQARARRARRRYGQFLQYRNWPVELARLAYFAPIIRGYAAFHLPRSYERIARACQLKTAGS